MPHNSNDSRDRCPHEAVLIVGHGTRSKEGIAEFQATISLLKQLKPDWRIEGCFLELAEPSMAVAIERLVISGARRIRVLPLLLFAAGHARQDIPRALAEAAARHPGVELWQAPHLGCHPALVELSERREREGVSEFALIPPAETLLILVGRGSLDPSARQEMLEFAQLRAQRTTAGQVEVGFLAMAQPPVREILAQAAAQPRVRRVIVQPHLLFRGDLLDDLRRMVSCRNEPQGVDSNPRQWLMAPPLGPDPLLAAAILERLTEPLPPKTKACKSLS